jgi:hypothetical protein
MVAFFRIVLRFVIDVIFGVVGFAIVGFAAYVLNLFIGWLEDRGIPFYLIQILRLLEYGLFFLDIVGFSFLVIIAFYKMIREIWSLRNDP